MRRLEFTSLQVVNLEKSKSFYTEKLGFELSEMNNPQAAVFKYNKGEASFAIRTPVSDLVGKELGNGVAIWFSIDGKIEDFKAGLIEKGLTDLPEIMQTPFGKAIHVLDPDGYKLTFLESNN